MRGFGLDAITASMTATIANQTTLESLGFDQGPHGDDGPLFLLPPRITPHQPWGPDSPDVSHNLRYLSNLLNKTSRQRMQEEFGHRLIMSATHSTELWNSTLQIRQIVSSMRSDSEKIEGTKGLDNGLGWRPTD